MKSFQVDASGFYGRFGGAYVPEILYKTVEDLKNAYLPIIESKEFQDEYRQLLRDYVGRPSPLYFAKRMSEKYGCQLYLKREDLNHTGAHKINNAIGQILIAKRMGKTRIVAETGAGQHGVATATVCALSRLVLPSFRYVLHHWLHSRPSSLSRYGGPPAVDHLRRTQVAAS